jgi:transcriptional regulator with XRE-family HTH domain
METIGNTLKTAREKIKMSREDVAKATHLKTLYIEVIEKNEFHKLIAPVYAKGFIKLYAQCVQIDPAPLLRQFSALETTTQTVTAGRALAEKKAVVPKKAFWNVNAFLLKLLGSIKKIKLPDLRQVRIPAFKPIEASLKRWLLITAAAAVCVIFLSVLIKNFASSSAQLKVPQSCRWIADPPEPYFNLPAPKTPRSR